MRRRHRLNAATPQKIWENRPLHSPLAADAGKDIFAFSLQKPYVDSEIGVYRDLISQMQIKIWKENQNE